MVELRFEDSETLEDLSTYVARARTLDSDGAIGSCLRGIRPWFPDTRESVRVSAHGRWTRLSTATGYVLVR